MMPAADTASNPPACLLPSLMSAEAVLCGLVEFQAKFTCEESLSADGRWT